MKIQVILEVNNKEFGAGVYIKKENMLSLWNYSLHLKLLWFTFSIKTSYGDKLKQWANRN